mmetsp:Transcript_4123/g.6545  ORF Transcript_4123/g.6545 Transcript_4123/m.6545 type:complete len:87 (-) Transcript_4123:3040-3300(-)
MPDHPADQQRIQILTHYPQVQHSFNLVQKLGPQVKAPNPIQQSRPVELETWLLKRMIGCLGLHIRMGYGISLRELGIPLGRNMTST